MKKLTAILAFSLLTTLSVNLVAFAAPPSITSPFGDSTSSIETESGTTNAGDEEAPPTLNTGTSTTATATDNTNTSSVSTNSGATTSSTTTSNKVDNSKINQTGPETLYYGGLLLAAIAAGAGLVIYKRKHVNIQ